jgi:hypothetical protein
MTGFEYEHPKLDTPSIIGGDFHFNHEQIKQSLPVLGGSFVFDAMKIEDFKPPKPAEITWGTFWWGDGHTYGEMIGVEEFPYEHLGMKESIGVGGTFEFEHLQMEEASPKSLSGFDYERL